MPNLDFVFYGERPALDFANTLRRRRDPYAPTTDLLTKDGLSAWFDAAHAHTTWASDLPTTPPTEPECSESLNAALQLRELIITLAEEATKSATSTPHATLADPNHRPAPADLNSFATRATLLFSADNSGTLLPTVTPDVIISIVAQDALRLFTSSSRNRIKMCSHERCGILFEDRSNGMRRQWCSMKECGNRAKAARHASIHSTS